MTSPVTLVLVLDAIRLALLDRIALLVEVRTKIVDRLGDRVAELLLDLVAPVPLPDLAHHLGVLGVEPLKERLVELLDALDLDAVEVAARARVDGRHLVGRTPRLQ